MFPSRQYPEALIYPETKLTVEDVRGLIRHAHRRGMRFLLGSGVFAWFGVAAIAASHPSTKAVEADGMCPCHAESRDKQTAMLMRRALDDSRRELGLNPDWQPRINAALARADRLAAARRQNCPATVVATSQYNDTSYEAYRAIDADPATSWLCVDRAPLPQTLTITLKQPRQIDYIELTQGAYHPAYHTRAYHVESSLDRQTFSPLCQGELPRRLGSTPRQRLSADARTAQIGRLRNVAWHQPRYRRFTSTPSHRSRSSAAGRPRNRNRWSGSSTR